MKDFQLKYNEKKRVDNMVVKNKNGELIETSAKNLIEQLDENYRLDDLSLNLQELHQIAKEMINENCTDLTKIAGLSRSLDNKIGDFELRMIRLYREEYGNDVFLEFCNKIIEIYDK